MIDHEPEFPGVAAHQNGWPKVDGCFGSMKSRASTSRRDHTEARPRLDRGRGRDDSPRNPSTTSDTPEVEPGDPAHPLSIRWSNVSLRL
jgi:hypothetical protein